MNGFNRVQLLGNLGADPELRVTQGGQPVLNMRLACSETYLDRDKNRQEKTEWVNVVVWGKRGEGLGKILGKGDRIFVEGQLRTSSYDDKDGNKRYKTEVNAREVVLCGGKGNGGSGGGGGGGSKAPADAGGNAPPDDFGYGGDDDIPFARVETRWDRP